MSIVGIDTERMLESYVGEPLEPTKSDTNDEGDKYLSKENGLCNELYPNDDNDQLVQMVMELNFQNEYLKSQFESLKIYQQDSSGSHQQTKTIGDEDEKMLHEKIESLNRELLEEKQTRGAAEDALTHLRAAFSEADTKAQELSAKLAEAQQKMDQQLKERDEKYSELDSKFSRLHKRAKQRIQDVQKEKDDLEAQLRDLNEKAERAAAQQSLLQKELERTRQQANEALKAMDMERQQLRTANNRFRDNIDELRRSVEPKENALEALQQSLLEKEQMMEDMRGLLQAAEEKKQASISELSAKNQRHLESLEAQLSDALSDRNKATETISSLQVLIVEKDSRIAEMETASSGEAARLGAYVESIKGELVHLRHEHEKEKESWQVTTQTLRTKLEVAESNCIRAEIEAAKMRSQLEFEASIQTQLLNTRDSELAAAREEINRLESEFSSYKVRAHALLQKKDVDLAAAKDSEQLIALEEALKEAEKELMMASSEKDRALQDLQDAFASHDQELAERDAALSSAKQQIKSLGTKLDSANARYQSEKEALEINLQNVEETWQMRYDEALNAQSKESSGQDFQKELEELKRQHKKFKEEHDSFCDLADRMIEEKDAEISKLLNDNKNLHRSLELRPQVDQNDIYNTVSQKQDGANLSHSVAEQQILILARQQAQREEELAQSQRHILALQEEIEELEQENRLHSQQEAMLKAELRNMERTQKREGVDMTYLKNVVLKLLETGEVEALLPVIGMLLQFSPDEMQKCHQAYRTSTDVPPSPASDASGSGRSLFSRFSFS